MSEFFNVVSPDEALSLVLARLSKSVVSERVNTQKALGRVTAENIVSEEDLPSFARSTMDGFSVRSRDTFGATESTPAYLELVDEVSMGKVGNIDVSVGQAAKVYTGGALARGSDSVVMVENTQVVNYSNIEVMRPVAPGENVIQVGEDIRYGGSVIQQGRSIRPEDIGGLLSLGIVNIRVAKRPRVSIVSTGDELVPPQLSPNLGQVRDINSYTIAALVEQSGGTAIHIWVVPDDYSAQRIAALEGLEKGDVLIFSAGSSVSSRDMTASVLGDIGKPGILAHGIAHKPGKPTIVAMIDDKPAFGLPGNPISAMVVFNILVRPTIRSLLGAKSPFTQAKCVARLKRDLPSIAGREDHVPVKLSMESGSVVAEPLFGKSNLIHTLIRADGSVIVPLNKGGLYAGEEVEVRLI